MVIQAYISSAERSTNLLDTVDNTWITAAPISFRSSPGKHTSQATCKTQRQEAMHMTVCMHSNLLTRRYVSSWLLLSTITCCLTSGVFIATVRVPYAEYSVYRNFPITLWFVNITNITKAPILDLFTNFVSLTFTNENLCSIHVTFIVLCCIVLALAIHSAYCIKRFSLLTAMMSNKLLGLDLDIIRKIREGLLCNPCTTINV